MRKRRKFLSRKKYHGYHKKNFRNPFFSTQIRKTPSRLKKIYKYLLIGGTVLILYILFFSPLFKINKIEINGTQMINPQDIQSVAIEQLNKKRLILFPQDNFFFLSKGQLEERINTKYALKNLELKKRRKKLIINIEEKVSGIVWVTGEQYFFADLEGTIIREIPTDELDTILAYIYPDRYQINSLDIVTESDEPTTEVDIDSASGEPETKLSYHLPICINEDATPVSVGSEILSNDMINSIILLGDKLAVNTEFDVNHFSFQSASSFWLKVLTEQGIDLYFDTTRSIDDQITNLITVVDQNIDNLSAIQYIDLRFEDKVYYK